MRTRILLILLLIAVAWPAQAQMAPGPQDLWRQITLYRDKWGVPHVYADTPRALGFGFGYVQAEDHLERMLLAYRYATGRAAEVLGEPFAPTDALAISLNHAGLARDAFASIDGEMRDLLEGFALGVNAYLADWPDRAPEWADGIAPWEPLALLHCYLMSFAPWDLPDVPRPPTAAVTGNAWAVSPARSQSGEAMLVMNPHTDYEGPFQWYEAHLAAPGLHVYGATLYGLPVLLQGHNENLGWALTPNNPDNADVYQEQRRMGTGPRNPNVIRQPGDDEPRSNPRLRTRPRYYFVRQGDTFEQRVVHVNDTERGPLIAMDGMGGYTWHAAGYREFGAMRQLYDMARAPDYDTFRSILARQQLPCFHVLYADRSGAIAYHYNARVADKALLFAKGLSEGVQAFDRTPIDWTKPVPAWDSTYFWGGTLGLDALPSLVNPESGFLQACGTPPWGVTTGISFDQSALPSWLVNERDSYRARRVRQLLSLGSRNFTDMQDMVFDVLVPFSLSAVPRLVASADATWATSAHPDAAPALEIMKQWDGSAEPDRLGMTLFHLWWNAYRVATPDYANETDRMEAFLKATDPAPGLAALEQAARLMRNEYNSIEVPWGEAHRILRTPRDEPMPGALSGDPIWTASDTAYTSGRWHARYGYGFAMAISFGDIPQAFTLVPFGASDDPQSLHYDDQLDLMLDRRLKSALFHPAQVQRHAVRAIGTMIPLRAPATEGTLTFSADRPIEARLFASATPPAPLPEGLALYTPCLEPRYAPPGTPMTLEMELVIPAELGDDALFTTLAVWGYTPDSGWHPVPIQQANPAARTLSARGDGALAYAVLGQGPGLTLPLDSPDLQGAPIALYETPEATDSQTEETDTPPEEVEIPESAAEEEVELPAPPPVGASEQGVVEIPESFTADPSRGPVTWGRVLELTHPVLKGRVQVIREEAIGARLVLPSAPPELPEGLAAFSPVVTIEASEPNAAADVVVTLGVADEVCAAENLSRLGLYLWRADAGWILAEGASFDETDRRFTAKDTACNTYAVLGPAECLIIKGE